MYAVILTFIIYFSASVYFCFGLLCVCVNYRGISFRMYRFCFINDCLISKWFSQPQVVRNIILFGEDRWMLLSRRSGSQRRQGEMEADDLVWWPLKGAAERTRGRILPLAELCGRVYHLCWLIKPSAGSHWSVIMWFFYFMQTVDLNVFITGYKTLDFI